MIKDISLWSGFSRMLIRDCLHSIKNPSQLLNPLLLFIIVSVSFPFAVDLSDDQLMIIGPGIIWIMAVLSFLLTLNNLYMTDAEDGCLDYILLSPQPLPLLVIGKTCAHWLLSGLPLVVTCPIIAIFYQMQIDTMIVMIVTLLMGTFALSLIGSIAASLTISSKNNSILLSLLVLPITIPLLIFGTKTVILYQQGSTSLSGLYFIAAYCMFSLSFSPFASAAALRIGTD